MHMEEVCAGTGNERRGLEDWEKWQTRVTFWKRMTKRFEAQEIEEKKKEKAQMRCVPDARPRSKGLRQITKRLRLQAKGSKVLQ